MNRRNFIGLGSAAALLPAAKLGAVATTGTEHLVRVSLFEYYAQEMKAEIKYVDHETHHALVEMIDYKFRYQATR